MIKNDKRLRLFTKGYTLTQGKTGKKRFRAGLKEDMKWEVN